MRRHWRLVVAALLVVYATMAFTASLGKGQSFDEGLQLAVGYNIWLNDEFRIEGANGDLIKRWTTLPFLVSRPHFTSTSNLYWKSGMPYELAHRFFFRLGNRPEALLQQARAMNTLLGVATGLLVFWCAREIFGAVGGLVSLTVFASSPHMLAFGGIVSTDMSITLTLFGSTWCIWKLLHRITPGRLITSLAFFGALVLAKLSALVIFPVTLVMLAIRFAVGAPMVVGWGALADVGGRRLVRRAPALSCLFRPAGGRGRPGLQTSGRQLARLGHQPARPPLSRPCGGPVTRPSAVYVWHPGA